MSSKADATPNFTPGDYVKFFGAGALAATLTHGVSFPVGIALNQECTSC